MLRQNWLDRLRRSNGLPAEDSAVDLEHFLSSLPNPNLIPSPPSPPGLARPRENPPVFDLVTSALADLFVMGGPSREKLKSLRKQPSPKICAVTPAPVRSQSSADNSVAVAKKGRPAAKPMRKRRPLGSDLGGYSRTEVTVIDTSSNPGWKADKIIFRKGLVWKVRDKKLWNFNRRKRKFGMVDRLGGEKEKGKQKQQFVGEIKTQPPPAQGEGLCSLNEEYGRSSSGNSSKEDRDLIPIRKKRPKFSRSPRVPAAKDSSVFHIKVVSGSGKSSTTCSKNNPRG